MLANYLRVAVRRLLRNKFYLFANTLGVGIAIGCAMTSYLLIAYNIEFDNTVDKERVKNIVKVVHHRKETDGDPFMELAAPIALAPAASQEIAGITRFTRFCSTGGYLSFKGEGYHETISFADAAFMSMFQPGLTSGSYEAFAEKNTIFITQKYATKYFGKEEAVGRTMDVQINGRKIAVTVGAVMTDAPFNSTFVENILMRIENFIQVYDVQETNWAAGEQASVLFELSDVSQAGVIERVMTKYVTLRNELVKDAGSERYELLPFLQPVSPNDVRSADLHLRIPNIALVIFGLLGGIILLIACFNLTNTTLALSMKQFKEIGVRRVVGSSRLQVATQLIIETGLTVVFAIVVGFSLSLFLIPEFASMWQLPYGLSQLNSMNMVIALLVLLCFVALLAGSYPALLGSRQNPVALFRGAKSKGGTNALTRTLLVGQFALSVVVLIAGIMFTRNAAWQDTISFGYDKDKLITALVQGSQEAEALSSAIRDNPQVHAVAPSVHHFALINAPKYQAQMDEDRFAATMYEVGPGYFSTLGMKMVDGRLFNLQDTVNRNEIVVDENFLRHRGLTDPFGKVVELNNERFTIVGIVSNHLTDLESDNSENFIYRLARPDQYQILVISGAAGQLKATEQFVQKQWKGLYPDKPLRTDLQEDVVYLEANTYNGNLSKIFLFMTVMGCVLSLTGLYAMARLNIQKREKEIGVRKVLGASVTSIIRLVNAEFAIILSIAALLGTVGGYTLTQSLMSHLFKQHIEVTTFPVVLCAIFIFLVGIAATTYTIWKAAVENPVNVLKNE
jgi:ABC-type antimicrobial peptide transport system permease subunit